MSPSNPQHDGPMVQLDIKAATPLTEIRVTDSKFRKIELENNVGSARTPDLPEGLYEVGFRDGPAWHFQTVIARAAPKPIPVKQKSTGSAAEALTAPDEELPEIVEDHDDTRSALTVVLRTSKTADAPLPDAIGHYVRGTQLVRLDGGAAPAPQQELRSRTGRMTFALDSGYWILRLNLDSDDRPLEIPLVTCPGWRTRIYLPLSVAWDGAATVDPGGMQIRLLRGHSPDDERIRRLESQALYSLAGERRLQGPELTTLLKGLLKKKFLYPMLGIYGGYLLPCERREELDLLTKVVTNLKQLLGGDVPHPDVTALEAKIALRTGASLSNLVPFECPPLLMAGWQVMIEAARVRPDLVGRGTLPDRIAGELWGSSPWVMWSQPDEPRALAAPPPMATGAAVVAGAAVAAGAPLIAGAVSRRAGGAPRTAITAPRIAGAAPRVAGGAPPVVEGVEQAAAATPKPAGFEEQCGIIFAGLLHRPLREWFRQASSIEPLPGTAAAIDEVQRRLSAQLLPITSDEHSQASRLKTLALDRSAPSERSIGELSSKLQLPPATIARAAETLSASFLQEAEQLGIDLKARAIMARPQTIIPYDPNFLGDGFAVPLPALSDELALSAFAEGAVIDYAHYSLAMHQDRRVAIYCACNIDAARAVRVAGGLKWHMDERVGEFQIGPEAYADNQLDRGHLARRKDVCWGSVAEAKAANRSTFFYTNAAPQHQNFNQDEWVTLEDWVLDDATEFSYRLCVFTGPVLRSNDPYLEDLPPNLRTVFGVTGRAQIPAAFWKIVALRDGTAGGDDLAVAAFAMRQSDMWNDRDGSKLLKLKVHQVTVEAIEGWTGLDFGELSLIDALAWSDDQRRLRDAGEEPEWPVVTRRSDIRVGGANRRLRGIRSVRTGTTPSPSPSREPKTIHTVASGCECDKGDSFDARAAVEALSRDLAQLTEIVARQGTAEPAAAPTPATPARSRSRSRAAAPLPAEASSGASDPRIESVVASAPDKLKDAMRAFAEITAAQADVAAGRRPPPTPTELTRIVGGQNVPPGGFPSCCAIGDNSQWFCTGVVIAERAVLTAAHCGASITRIMVGGEQVKPWLTPGARLVSVRKAIVHERYRRHPWNENDINLLILDTPAMVAPAKIATAAQIAAATEVRLVGFGYNDPERPIGFGTKRHTTVPMAPLGDPAAAANLKALEDELGFHRKYEFVAGRKALGRDSCNGDSGGPAYLQAGNDFIVAGLTSRATRAAVVNCGDGGIYVRPDQFLGWINGKLADAGLPPVPAR